MNVERIEVDARKARDLHALYHQHRKDEGEMDAEIRRVYKLIGQGRMVIQALASITAAGRYADGHNAGYPKLAIARADAKVCTYEANTDRCTFYSGTGGWNDTRIRAYDRRFNVSMPGVRYTSPNGAARVPMIPIHLRPKTAICAYHILWEADWKVIPRDPMLLRRIGGDMWLVVAAWDLTPVERAAMAHRLSA